MLTLHVFRMITNMLPLHVFRIITNMLPSHVFRMLTNMLPLRVFRMITIMLSLLQCDNRLRFFGSTFFIKISLRYIHSMAVQTLIKEVNMTYTAVFQKQLKLNLKKVEFELMQNFFRLC